MESECKCPEEGGRWTRVRSGKKAGVVQRMKRHHCVCVPVSAWDEEREEQGDARVHLREWL